MYCLCVNVYCTTATRCQPNCIEYINNSLKNGSSYGTPVQDIKSPIKYYKVYLKYCVISAYLTKEMENKHAYSSPSELQH